jgi:hypothetical protein
MAKVVGRTQRAALWSDGALLGMLDFETGDNAVVVTMPRQEQIECAALSEDGSLLAAASQAGSVALWSRNGALLSELRSEISIGSCSDSDFTFSLPSRRVIATAGNGPARLLGERFAVALVDDGKVIAYPTFTSNGRRLFVNIGKSVRVFDTSTGKALGELPGSAMPRLNSDEKYLALQTSEDKVGLYDAASLALLQTVAGMDPQFHLDLLVVALRGKDPWRGSDDKFDDSVAYRLQPFAKVWQRAVAIYDEAGAGGPGFGQSPWRVGGSPRGYSVIDVRTGAVLASWRGSGYACGYQWAVEKGTLVFIEGDLLTFWSKTSGATTHQQSECAGALTPEFARDRSRFIGLTALWDIEKRRRLMRIETEGAQALRFSRDEQLVLGMAFIGELIDPQIAAWNAATGRLVWHQKMPELGEYTDHPAWYLGSDERSLAFFDETERRFIWVGNVIDPDRGVQRLVFDERCWAGPNTLPAPDALPRGMPSRRCPELAASFVAKVSKRSRADPPNP